MEKGRTKIMIIDDNAFMRMMMKEIFTGEGYDVLGEFDKGRTAIKAYETLSPDIITMDITMPDMNGVEAVKRLRAVHPEARIIMVSAMNQAGLVLDAMEAGAWDFVAKPFRKERLVAAVERLMSRNAGTAGPSRQIQDILSNRPGKG